MPLRRFDRSLPRARGSTHRHSGSDAGDSAVVGAPTHCLPAPIPVYARTVESEPPEGAGPGRGAGGLQERVDELERERAGAVDALRVWERKYQFLFSNMLTGYAYHRVVLDETGAPVDYVFLEVNKTFEDLTGLRGEDLVGRRVTEALPGIEKDPGDWIGRYGRVALGGGLLQFDQHSQNLDRWFKVTAWSPEPEHFVVIFHDVTESKRIEEELRQRDRQLEQARKMEAVGQFAAGIAHDFNNLLTGILGFADLICTDVSASAASRANARRILDAAQQGAGLTQDLLAFGRKQARQPKRLDLNAMAEGARPLLARLLPASIAVELDLRSTACGVEADPVQLNQVLLNLAVNARDAMPSGGGLRISVREVVVDAGGLPDVGGPPAGRWVCMSVVDSGTGIDPDVLPRIFEPFFTTKDRGKGTGLGLATVYGIVTQNGGVVRASNSEHGGAVFDVFLPRCDLDLAAADAGAHGEAADEGPRGGRILVVDDSDTVLQLVRQVLERAGYDVITADRGAAGLELVRQLDRRPDLVLLDVMLPDMSGLELASHLRAAWPGIRLLFSSGYSVDELGTADGELSSDEFLSKPYEPATLVSRVRKKIAVGSGA